MRLAAAPRVSPRWLREDERDSIPWERRQDHRLENLLAALAVRLGDLVQERMAAAARCSPTAVAALQWVGRGRGLRTCDLAEALGITMPGASQLVASLIADGLVQRARSPHDHRQWRLHLTELGGARTLAAVRARAEAVGELVGTLPFPWRLRLIRILERLLGRMVDSPQAVLRVCRHCDWNVCRRTGIEPCPAALAQAERMTSSRRAREVSPPRGRVRAPRWSALRPHLTPVGSRERDPRRAPHCARGRPGRPTSLGVARCRPGPRQGSAGG